MVYKRVSISIKIFEKTTSVVTWIDGRPILIARYSGKYYGMDAVCAHMGCAILDRVEENRAICPAHGAEYDITNGKRVKDAFIRPEAVCEYDDIKAPLRTYEVKENEGFLEIDL
ncbi:MAG: Rieske (2Fe-2S) protein [Thermoplasmata archaeon]